MGDLRGREDRQSKVFREWQLLVAYLLHGVSIEENPSQLDDLGGILGDIDAMLVTGGGNVDHDIAIDVELRLRLGGHDDMKRWR